MNSENQMSDMDEEEFQRLIQMDAESLMPTLAKLRRTNPVLFHRLLEYIERRWADPGE